MDEVSDSVKAIGCLNTITRRDGRLYAENTDWVAIYELVNTLDLRLTYALLTLYLRFTPRHTLASKSERA